MTSNAAVSLPGDDPALPPRFLAVRADEFDAWLESAGSGACIQYHRGFLPLDRDRGFSPLGEHHRQELIDVATRAMAQADGGQLLLVQRRHGHCDYSYVAIQPRQRPRNPLKTRNRGGR